MDALPALPIADHQTRVNSSKPEASLPEPSPPEAIALADLLKQEQASETAAATPPPSEPVREFGGRRDGPEPTRYGDWEKNGRCIDF